MNMSYMNMSYKRRSALNDWLLPILASEKPPTSPPPPPNSVPLISYNKTLNNIMVTLGGNLTKKPIIA